MDGWDGWMGWMDGWYPGGRGYRAPYGANKKKKQLKEINKKMKKLGGSIPQLNIMRKRTN